MRGTIIRVQVQRLPARTRRPKGLRRGGPAPAIAILGPGLSPGGPMCAGSTCSTPSASASRVRSGGPCPYRGILSEGPTGGPGWCWPPTPSCAWPASSPATSGCRGSGPDPSLHRHPIGCGVAFRGLLYALGSPRLPRETRRALPRPARRAAARDLRAVPAAMTKSLKKPPTTAKSRCLTGPAHPPHPPTSRSTASPACPKRGVKSLRSEGGLMLRMASGGACFTWFSCQVGRVAVDKAAKHA